MLRISELERETVDAYLSARGAVGGPSRPLRLRLTARWRAMAWSSQGRAATYDRLMATIAQFERGALRPCSTTSVQTLPRCARVDHATAAHLVSRERRGDAALGLTCQAAGRAHRLGAAVLCLAAYAELVANVRGGAPFWSVFSVPGADRLLNDGVLRASRGRVAPNRAGSRATAGQVQDGLWEAVKGRAKLSFRGTAFGVTLTRPGGESVVATSGSRWLC